MPAPASTHVVYDTQDPVGLDKMAIYLISSFLCMTCFCIYSTFTRFAYSLITCL